VYKKYFQIFFGILLFSTALSAQEISPQGKFIEDSVKIGMRIPYTLSIKYPTRMDVVFPDSLYDYSPFELEDKTYFPTKSDSTHSYDSAIYYLSTFEIDSIQFLRLPVYFVNNSDSIPVYADKDSVFLVELIPVLPDSIQLIENTSYFNVPTQFNYPYLLIGLAIFTIIAIILLIIFGSRIKIFFQIRRLKKRHDKFLDTYDQLRAQINEQSSALDKEHVAFVWKKYVEKLEKQPITKLTTKEITNVLNLADEMVGALKQIDRVIYSGQKDVTLSASFDAMRSSAIDRYNQKTAAIKNNG
jgi:hypothetical protein